jgi:cyclopropane-fatty-acyl-phospholipid synthase
MATSAAVSSSAFKARHRIWPVSPERYGEHVFARSAALRQEVARALPERPFAVRFWDGTEVPATDGGGPTFILRSPRALAHMIRRPGELGLGRAYITGDLDVPLEDLDAAVALVVDWEPPPVPPRDIARLALAALRSCGLVVPPRVPSIELRQRGRLHSVLRDRRAVRHHYDAGNEFFALFLDPSMTYSCAMFSRGAKTLEEAQETKLEVVCQKLRLEEGDRVLDVGCGWGSFAIHAASRHGARVVGITLSEPQAQLARQRAGEAGVADRVEFRVADYRELRDPPFDAIASIGMVEHVGATHLGRYAAALASALKPGGRLLNHGIAQVRYDPDDPFDPAGPISQRYVFPDGDVAPLSYVQRALEHAGFVTEHVEGFGADYATTLSHWIERFDARFDEAAAIAGSERARLWQVYLRAGRHGFATGSESVYQVLCRKPAG